MYIALQDMHAPNQVPEAFSAHFPAPKYECASPPSSHDYCVKNGMGTAADEVFGER